MDEDRFQYVCIAAFIIILIAIFYVPVSNAISEQKDETALGFIMSQCLNESSINVSYSTGCFSINKNNISGCLIKNGC